MGGMRTPNRLALALTLAALSGSAFADVELPSVFSDHMVLQRDQPTPIWGRADVGERITVEFGGEKASAQAGADGSWSVTLHSREASAESRDLVVRGTNEIVIKDVLVGEVWVCSGQSNMEWVVANSNDAANEIAAGKYPRIRHFKAAHSLSHEPQFTVPGSWSVCAPSTVGDFSAVAYFFGRDLLENLDVPIGLIGTNWGGTRAEPWTDPNALAEHRLYKEAIQTQRTQLAAFHSMSAAERELQYQAALARAAAGFDAYWAAVTAKEPGMSEGWYGPEYKHTSWRNMPLPGLWEQAKLGLDTVDGLVWFRHEIEIPEAWAGKPLRLQLGMIDDSDRTFFNGVAVGSVIGQHTTQRDYVISGQSVEAGKALISVLVYDTGGSGGFNGPASAMQIGPVDTSLGAPQSLATLWNWKRGAAPQRATAPKPVRRPGEQRLDSRTPGAMYNAMIHPFVPYGMRGAIWYQGESNAGQAEEYRELLPLMIRSWRDAFGQGEFPFGVVQLASFKAPALDRPVEGDWANLRDAQTHTARTLANTGIIVASDVGEARDIHPRNKQEVGRRLALWARATAYGEESLEYSGPVYTKVETRGNELVLSFDHADGLKTSDGKLPAGFAISGATGDFVWAEARIEGATVILSGEGIRKPTAARFGWCNNLEHLNLVNSAGLPASPFRTDS